MAKKRQQKNNDKREQGEPRDKSPEPSSSGEKPEKTKPPFDFREWALGWAKSIAIAVVLWFFIQAFLLKSYRIDSGSMEPTLFENDFLFINKAVYGAKAPLLGFRTPAFRDPRRGELIVLRGIEWDSLTIVKRVIGLAGDTLQMRRDSLFRNGEYVPEPYAQHVDPSAEMEAAKRLEARRWQLPQLVDGAAKEDYLPGMHDWGPFVIPDGHLFTMGDNRDASHDGRAWGFLPRNHVIGHPLFIYYSFDKHKWRPLPFLTAIRWGRLLRNPG